MSTDRKRAKARKDITEAAYELADAGRIAGGTALSTLSGAVSEVSGSVSDPFGEARRSLAAALDPTPARPRRAPWIVAALMVTAVAVLGWSTVLRRHVQIDPGTPSPTTAPSDDQIHGKPVGQRSARP